MPLPVAASPLVAVVAHEGHDPVPDLEDASPHVLRLHRIEELLRLALAGRLPGRW